jgi:hypothetical protein
MRQQTLGQDSVKKKALPLAERLLKYLERSFYSWLICKASFDFRLAALFL